MPTQVCFFIVSLCWPSADVWYVNRCELDGLDRWADRCRVHEAEKQLGKSLRSLFAFFVD